MAEDELVFVGIEHTRGNKSDYVMIDLSGKCPRVGANFLDIMAKEIADKFGTTFEEHVTLQVPENIEVPCFELTTDCMELLKTLIEKNLTEK